ncbi:MAG: prepilin-type N-terminal cleavage/methylation domain-containing protein [Planctomycetota bacterium]
MREHKDRRRREGGFTMVELAITLSLLVIGLLGFVGAILSAQLLSRTTRERALASSAAIDIVEDFRVSCMTNFTAAMTAYSAGVTPTLPPGLGADATATSTLILDETKIVPPLDLDGNGLFVDVLTPDVVNAGVLRVVVRWRGARGLQSIEYTTIIARGEMK